MHGGMHYVVKTRATHPIHLIQSLTAERRGEVHLVPASSDVKWGSDLPKEMLRSGLLNPAAGPDSPRLWLDSCAA